MHKSPLLDPILPKVRQQVLAATLLQPDRSWYLSELAHYLGVTPSTLQRELSGLSTAGILERRADGNRVYFKANEQCPILGDLQGLLIKTVGLVDLLRNALKPVSKQIDLAFVFGSFAESKEFATSDIDLLVVLRSVFSLEQREQVKNVHARIVENHPLWTKALSGNKLDIVVPLVTLIEWKTRRSSLPFRRSTTCSVP